MNETRLEALDGGDKIFVLHHLNAESPEITEHLISAFTEQFRCIFANQPYGQLLFYPSEGRAISAQEVFQTDQYVEKERLDQLELSAFQHPETGEQALWWVDPERTKKRFRQKFRRKLAFLSLLKEAPSSQILEASFGYFAFLEDLFANEEWQNPFYYSTLEDPQTMRNFQTFFEKVREAVQATWNTTIDETTLFFCHNCLFIDPQLQGQGIGYQVEARFLQQIPEGLHELFIISEMIIGSKIYQLALEAGATPVPGILSNETKDGHGILMISKLKKTTQDLQAYLASFA